MRSGKQRAADDSFGSSGENSDDESSSDQSASDAAIVQKKKKAQTKASAKAAEKRNAMTINKKGTEVPGTVNASGHFGVSDIFASVNAAQ